VLRAIAREIATSATVGLTVTGNLGARFRQFAEINLFLT
jgi:hypothetical protein